MPPERTDKGLLGALLDANFNHLVTPKLIKLLYVFSLLFVTFSSLIVLACGIWLMQIHDGWLVGLLVIGASPVVWVFQAVLARVFLEAVVVRFKTAEHLRVIKDKI
ncbi:DUF4282 domain-containing protein [Actinomadura sp. 21ATH]|uniref:DUF4282 domain-containing protein n=1 Tax=Actinomadura sp. 21ATH TaxID=1735444 RepID=UPI0035C1BE95